MPRNKSEKGQEDTWEKVAEFLRSPEFQQLINDVTEKMAQKTKARRRREAKLHKAVLKGEI